MIITKRLRSAAKALKKQTEKTDKIRKIVEGYQKEILKKYKFKVDPDILREERKNKIIFFPEHTYLMSNKDFKVYLKETHEKHIENGFKVKFGYCPLLISQAKKIQTEKELIDAARYITKFKKDQYIPLEQRSELISLTIKLVG